MNSTSQIASVKWTQSALRVLATTLQLTSYMYPEQALVHEYLESNFVPDGDVFDYIVVGAGSAGCVIANRLTEDPTSRVLLVEAGGDPPLESDLPALQIYTIHAQEDWNYTSVYDGYSQECHTPPVADITRGKMLGGCSSSNNMYYVRANPHDYDNWATITNDDTWKYNNVLPYFIKSEKNQDPNIWNTPNARFHGKDGYLGVTKQYSNITNKYLNAFSELGFDVVFDTNGNYTLGFNEPMLTIANDSRQSTATAFLSPIKNRPNLHVLKNTLVTKINFDKDNNAVSIDAIKENNERIAIKANKEIIVSAGTINSAQLLMLSGVGPKKHLEDLNINVISNLPVGENLQNHMMSISVYALGERHSSTEPPSPHKHSVPTIYGFVAMNKSQLYPDYQTASNIMNDDDLLQKCAFFYYFKNELCDAFYEQVRGREVMISLTTLLHPKSHGRILLQSVNPLDYPLIYTDYFTHNADLKNLITYTQDVYRLMNTSYFKEMNAKFLIPPSCALLEPDSEEFWKCQILCMATPANHYIGTCAIGSVVDGRLRVLGVQKLRVADGSVIPAMTSGNVNAPIIMIGEKAADFIKADNKV
ncbi:ecdysone oxidase-like [Galleria mellonella]|uniref:Ecdysone oxidase-like n=1 Tax=Galleria mellonella TaxID=7137 RepID=A0ABM3MWL5_GALME|nr:ecdysone oxidase-like [Galleria mellonella]